jgi:hypothetical protein
MWFFRDNAGMEIDLLLGNGEKLLAVEIKSGKTFNEDMTSGLKRWQKISGLSDEAQDRILIYAGSQKAAYKGIKIIPWNDAAFSPSLVHKR